jgi:hypothetical protein
MKNNYNSESNNNFHKNKEMWKASTPFSWKWKLSYYYLLFIFRKYVINQLVQYIVLC